MRRVRLSPELPPRMTRPDEWLPKIITAMEKRERVYILSTHATWQDLLRARVTAAKDREHTRRGGYVRAYNKHHRLVRRLDVVLDHFASLMESHPARPFAEACSMMPAQALKRAVEL